MLWPTPSTPKTCVTFPASQQQEIPSILSPLHTQRKPSLDNKLHRKTKGYKDNYKAIIKSFIQPTFLLHMFHLIFLWFFQAPFQFLFLREMKSVNKRYISPTQADLLEEFVKGDLKRKRAGCHLSDLKPWNRWSNTGKAGLLHLGSGTWITGTITKWEKWQNHTREEAIFIHRIHTHKKKRLWNSSLQQRVIALNAWFSSQ